MTNFANAIGDHRAIVFLEVDSLITVNCLSPRRPGPAAGAARRLRRALPGPPRGGLHRCRRGRRAQCPPRRAAAARAGISEIQGFFLNATHFDWTRKEIRYGDKISRMTGGKHFVVNTAMNGRGPVVPNDRVQNGNEDLCSPPGRGLGPLPTFNTGFPRVDALAWIAYPGRSSGLRRGRAADRRLLGRAGAVAGAPRELHGPLTDGVGWTAGGAGGSAARARDRAPADDQVAVHQARQLTRRGAVDRLVELQRQLAVAAGPGSPATLARSGCDR